ncbi:hypothetical protein BDF21DRAFT_386191 [Thamnidium elegans]|uniref:HypA-like protein n=1 Tax=Thamnidium elegans TaxID=101142 RepID=A0A8H7VW45_9FUNG|nr:hypothetical protein INT48_003036 [Thamnidium elegans]KAI8073619.1 hypothetical protein BDF21DRAFT_386191 [Thamnidium elegans]
MTSFKPSLPNKPETFTITTPGISPETALLSEQLLNRNNKEFHCFFNDRKFHNHLIHHLLAAYSLGASKEKIQEIFDDHAKDQRPIPPSVGKITRENYKEYLGKAESYTSFLHFFDSEIENYGPVDTVRRWVWSGDMLARTVGGAYHPVIHIGYGLEFDIHGIIAEGLAMSACTESKFSAVVPNLPSLQYNSLLPTQAQVYAENATSSARSVVSSFVEHLSEQISSKLGMSDKVVSPSANTDSTDIPNFLKENTLFPIFKQVQKDPAFEGVFKANDNAKFKLLFDNKVAVERIKHYVNQWIINDNTKDIQNKFKELHTFSAIAVGSTGIRKDHEGVLKLDFFMMHALTSSEFIHQYISRVAPSEAVSLLHAHLAVTMVYYISTGRPDFNIDGLLAYKSPNHDAASNNTWLSVFDKALSCKEPHVIKVVRSCAVAQVMYGPHQDANLNRVWLQVAEMALDKNGNWDFSGVGFDDSWSS